MTNRLNQNDWLLEMDIPMAGGQPDMGAGGPPMTQPGGPQDPMGTGDQIAEPTNMRVDQQDAPDISDDPQYPDMPEEGEEDDFEIWKIKYVNESIKGDYQKLISMIKEVRDRDLDPGDRKFVEDNLNVNFIRQNSTVFNASTEIRKLIKKDLDRTNPATSVLGHISEVLDQNPSLNEIYIKISGLGGGKADQHRKFIAALIGGVHVGSGGSNEDIVFQESDYSIRISTRFLSKWGDVNLGRWFLKEDDPERYLKEAELDRLESGSPEERDVLRRRVVIEAIAEQFKERAFIINVVGSDGTVQHLGWDLGTSLKNAYLDGKLVVRSKNSDAKEAFVDEQGSIIPIPNMSIYYVKEQQDLDGHGKPRIEELEFIAHRDGVLYLTAQLSLVKEASMSLQGMMIQESPYQGNPTDLLRIKRCVPGSSEVILRSC
jgi:hypothetical protein